MWIKCVIVKVLADQIFMFSVPPFQSMEFIGTQMLQRESCVKVTDLGRDLLWGRPGRQSRKRYSRETGETVARNYSLDQWCLLGSRPDDWCGVSPQAGPSAQD